LSISYPDWHMNLRASNTEPVVRLNMEAKSSALLKEKRNELAELIAPFRS
jgi:phosphomannomutase